MLGMDYCYGLRKITCRQLWYFQKIPVKLNTSTYRWEVDRLKTQRGRVLFARLSILLFYPPAGILITCSVQAMQEVEERADPNLPDIAAVHTEPGQAPVILYNPMLCKHAGPALCEFYRYHEYGHLELRHHKRRNISVQQKEQEADRWAATHAPLYVVMAAYRYFSNGGGSSPFHGEGRSRAARLLMRTENIALWNSRADKRGIRKYAER